jgi:tetratricopeptide (TPR) repeat protein
MIQSLRCYYFLALMFFIAIFWSSQPYAKPAFPISTTEELKVTSTLLGAESANFMVTLPHNYQQSPNTRYVVLLDLHPRSHLMLVGMHDWMSHNGGWPWPETIIITAPDGHQALGKLKQRAIEQQGDQALLDFFEQDLLPAIDKRYRTNGFRIFNGFTGNAGLVLYSLINRPSLFNAYIAASPVLSADFAYVLNDAPKKLKNMQDKPRFLFVSTSDSDFEQRQLDSFVKLEGIIQTNANSQLNYQIKRFDGSYYMTQPILATANGIEMIFNDVHNTVKPDSVIGKQGAKAIVEYYQHLSKQVYGFEISAVESLTLLADSQLKTDPQTALSTFMLAIETYPKEAGAHAALAEAYIQLGEVDKAKDSLRSALSLTEHPFYLDKWTKMLEGL